MKDLLKLFKYQNPVDDFDASSIFVSQTKPSIRVKKKENVVLDISVSLE